MFKKVFCLCVLAWSMVGCAVQPGGDDVANTTSALRSPDLGDDQPIGDDPIESGRKKKPKTIEVGGACHVSGTREVAWGTMGDNGWCCGWGMDADKKPVKDVCVNCNAPPQGAACSSGNTREIGIDPGRLDDINTAYVGN